MGGFTYWLGPNDGSMGDSTKNWKSFEEPFEGPFFNSSTTATYMGIFRNVAKFWHEVSQYKHTRRKIRTEQ